MAIIKTSSVVSEASGTIGGVVYARNQGGMYIRQWARPVNNRTEPQELVRARFGGFANQYRSLTDSQREGWEHYGRVVGRRNALGEQIRIGGLAAFVAGNTVLAAIGQGARRDPPNVMVGAPTIASDLFIWDEDQGEPIELGLFSPDWPANSSDIGYVHVSWSGPQSPGRMSPAGLAFSMVNPGNPVAGDNFANLDAASGASSLTPTNLPFVPTGPAAVFVRLRLVTVDARVSAPAYYRTVISLPAAP